MKLQACDTLSCLQTAGKDNTSSGGDQPLLAIVATNEHDDVFVTSVRSDDISPPNKQEDEPIDTLSALGKLVVQQVLHKQCKAESLNDGQAESGFHINLRELLARRSIDDESIQSL